MSDLSVFVYISSGLIIGIGITIMLAIFKDKKMSKGEKERIIFDIAIHTVKDALELSTIKSKDELEKYCVDKVYDRLNTLGYIQFTKDDISIAVDLAMKSIEKIVNRKFCQ